MKTGIYIAAVAIGFCAAGAVALYCWHRRKTAASIQKTETVEDRFISEWTTVLTEDARVFNGLFSGLQRVISGAAKKPEKVLREWCQRTHYKWENEQVDFLCQQHIVPLFEPADQEALSKWAALLLDAAAAAGIFDAVWLGQPWIRKIVFFGKDRQAAEVPLGSALGQDGHTAEKTTPFLMESTCNLSPRIVG